MTFAGFIAWLLLALAAIVVFYGTIFVLAFVFATVGIPLSLNLMTIFGFLSAVGVVAWKSYTWGAQDVEHDVA